MDLDKIWLWLRLQQTAGIGIRTAIKLVDYFSGIVTLFQQDAATLQRLGLTANQAEQLLQPSIDLVHYYQKLQKQGIQLLSYDCIDYPESLKNLYMPPLVLHVMGNSKLLPSQQIAVVGSRKISEYGKKCTIEFTKQLAAAGLVITSGFAVGVDHYAHLTCTEQQQPTIAVLGCGLDQDYPYGQRKLRQQILEHGGAIITEFLLGVPPVSYNFPRRNRIIAGLSLGVLVVEAAEKSGSLVTARLAVEAGKEVFAVPGSIHHTNTRGCHQLIQQGAKLAQTVEDILEELSIIKKNASLLLDTHAKLTVTTISDTTKKIADLLTAEPQSIDALVAQSGLNVVTVSTSLVELELLDLSQPVIGGYISSNSLKLERNLI